MVAKIFVSYAHVNNFFHGDNDSGGTQETRWVNHFANKLKKSLHSDLGRTEACELWIDSERVRGRDSIDPNLLKPELASSDGLVLMMSKGWLKSRWCRSELDMFIDTHADFKGRVFIVDLDSPKRNELSKREALPRELQDVVGYSFFTKTPMGDDMKLGDPISSDAALYSSRMVAVAADIGRMLEDNSSSEPVTTHKKIYLSPVSLNLDNDRRLIINNLAAQGIEAVPANNSSSEAMNVAIKDCELLVQLLDEDPLLDIPVIDYKEAIEAGVDVIQWCDPSLNIRAVQSDEHRSLLEGEFIVKSSPADFSKQIIKALTPDKTEELKSENQTGSMIFIHTGPEDIESAENIASALNEKGFGTALPRYNDNPAAIDESITTGIELCDKILMLHEKTPAGVIDQHLATAWAKILNNPDKPHPDIVVCSCSCADDPLRVHLPGTSFLTCNADFSSNCLDQFIEEVHS